MCLSGETEMKAEVSKCEINGSKKLIHLYVHFIEPQ